MSHVTQYGYVDWQGVGVDPIWSSRVCATCWLLLPTRLAVVHYIVYRKRCMAHPFSLWLSFVMRTGRTFEHGVGCSNKMNELTPAGRGA